MARLVAASLALLWAHASCAEQTEPATSGVDAGTDDCVLQLVRGGVALRAPAPSQNIALPVQVDRQLGPLLLVPRGPYPALMDCSLALALQKAAPVFLALGLNELRFSAAYDHRTRRGTSQLSSHSFGRAIDVHVFDGVAGKHDVAADFERGVGAWLHLVPNEGALQACIGSPKTERGRTLRTLVCRLKLETDLRIIVTPDDNDDHRDHIHLEYAAPYMLRGAAGTPPPPRANVTAPVMPRSAVEPKPSLNKASLNKVTKARKPRKRVAPPPRAPKKAKAKPKATPAAAPGAPFKR
ncbi:MAG: hypothetical protein SF187_30245 [Deltaproteobacteria bacterium]|nr:hypothetical protein [Deltaproteobacteria bacterium]